jgi:protein SCO1/2
MYSVTRRGLLAASALFPLACALKANACEVAAGPPNPTAAGPFAPPVSGREMMRRRYFPDVVLTTHEGKRVHFYEDLLKDRIVVLSLMYANCQGVCPTITANLEKVRKILIDQEKRNICFYSLTVKPEEDTPEVLKAYVELHRIGPGWQFLTGRPADVELLRSKLGFVDLNPQVDRSDPASHSGMVRFGNEPQAWWAACQGQANPAWIAREISFVVPAGRPTERPAAG